MLEIKICIYTHVLKLAQVNNKKRSSVPWRILDDFTIWQYICKLYLLSNIFPVYNLEALLLSVEFSSYRLFKCELPKFLITSNYLERREKPLIAVKKLRTVLNTSLYLFCRSVLLKKSIYHHPQSNQWKNIKSVFCKFETELKLKRIEAINSHRNAISKCLWSCML